MDYKEKYKEALERASKLRVQNPFDTVGQMVEHIFPELKESEDERIKREILDCINELANLKNEKIPTEWLEWLEKQSGQPTDKVESKFKVGDCEKKELKKIEHKMLDADEVIEWVKTKVYDDSTYGMAMIDQFKKDFGL